MIKDYNQWLNENRDYESLGRLNEYGSGPRYEIARVVDGNIKEVYEGTVDDLAYDSSNATDWGRENMAKYKVQDPREILKVETLDDLLAMLNGWMQYTEKKKKRTTRTVFCPKVFYDTEMGDGNLMDVWVKEGFPPVEEFSEKYKGALKGKKYGV